MNLKHFEPILQYYKGIKIKKPIKNQTIEGTALHTHLTNPSAAAAM